jgi:DNA invertase Pin-like site-specific DNA recombinase
MRSERGKTTLRCAIYTRVSTENGLEQEFNSLDNQREASKAYVKSQSHEGWKLIRTHYDDGGYSGGSMERPALKRLLNDVRAHRIDVIVVYKVARRTLIAIRTFCDLADQSSRAVGNPKFGVGDSFARSPAKARRPSRIDPADH